MIRCAHCDEQVEHAITDDKGKNVFCCQGCLTVFSVLHSSGLEEYYKIKHQSNSPRRRSPVNTATSHFRYLDEPHFLNEYTQQNARGERYASFYLEGIHCLACLWLIEKAPQLAEGVLDAKLDMEKSIVNLCFAANGKLSAAAQIFAQLGYRPHPLKKNQKAEELKQKEERLQLLRIGIAAAGASNIMLYAVSLYGGASGTYAQVFNFLTVLFALPVLSFSAWPFYRTAWYSIKNSQMSIDVPISMALILGGLMGVYELLVGHTENYFDSLTALVFLLLLSRYFLKRIQDKGLAAQDLHFFYHNESVKRVDGDGFSEVHPQFLRQGDVIELGENDFIPVDGIILKKEAWVNMSLLTGESEAKRLSVGAEVYAGTQIVKGAVVVRVDKTANETRLSDILKSVETGWGQKSSILKVTQQISGYFLWGVCALALLLFIKLSLQGPISHAFEQMITLLIVTCPCALALATPLTFTRALGLAARHGLVIKNDAVLEKISHVKSVVFDKTGTLTVGRPQVLTLELLAQSALPVEDILLSLETPSHHPIARALVDFSQAKKAHLHHVEGFEEKLGVGVFGCIGGRHYSVQSYKVFEDGKAIAQFDVQDAVREEAKDVLAFFKHQNIPVAMMTGDRRSIAQDVARQLGLSLELVHAEISPEEKREYVKNRDHVLMVGDGANDAMALTHASVGVAVSGSCDISLRAADVYMLRPGISSLPELRILAEETMKIIRRNLVLSLAYNSISVMAVFSGVITPLIAAIIMPLSSLSVLLSTLWGTKKQRNLWKS